MKREGKKKKKKKKGKKIKINVLDEMNKLLATPRTLDTWKLIGFALAIDIFVVKPLHIVFTIYFSKDSNWLSILKETVIKSATSTKQKKLEKEIGRLRIQDVMNIK